MGQNNIKLLVLGVGNILIRDEGLGVHVIRELEENYTFPENIRILDGGTLGLALTPILDEGYDHVLVVDALKADDNPGSIYKFSLDDLKKSFPQKVSPHEVGLLETLNLANLSGVHFDTTIIGIVPFEVKKWGMELSDKMQEKMGVIVDYVVKEIEELSGISLKL